MRDLFFVVSGVAAGAADELTRILTEKNPKDTTHSSKNWIPDTGQPHDVVGSKQEPDDTVQKAKLKELKTYSIKMGPIHVADMVDYINQLAGGSSGQAAAGWVDRAIDTVVEHMDSIFKQVTRRGGRSAATGASATSRRIK